MANTAIMGEEVDIRTELETALTKELEFTGSFSYKQDFSRAPNPSVTIEELGLIGLPLSERDAQAIKSIAEQAPFGMGERTIVDKEVRDTWEIDASKIGFQNPDWDSFLSETVISVCKTLGVNYEASAPRCELYKLLLYETGSHFLPHVDTEKTDGMFATIIVVLPSKFTGGEAHLSHSGLSAVYDSSSGSTYKTTIMAWYTDVTHEIKPITSGHRLALAYNLVHSRQSLRPVLSSNKVFVDRVRNALRAWNENEGHMPEKLLYLLDHKYSQANLRGSALKGADDHTVCILGLIAKELNFHLGLANVECHLSGVGDDEDGYGERDCYTSDEEADEPYHRPVSFGEVSDRDVQIKSFVDLDGNKIADSLEFDEEKEIIPADFVEDIESGPHDKEDYEGYMGNGAGSLERWYRRTVLVLWPDWNDCGIRYTGASFKAAFDDVNKVDLSPEKRTRIAEFLLRNSTRNPLRIAKCITQLAFDSDNLDLWVRSAKVCDPKKVLTIFGGEEFVDAILTLGFDNVRTTLESLVQDDTDNRRRYELLKRLQAQIEDQTAKFPTGIDKWVEDQIKTVLSTLKRPAKGDQAFYIQLAIDHGGIDYFCESIVPQIKERANGNFIRVLVVDLYKDERLPTSQTKTDVIRDLLETVILRTKLDIDKPKAKKSTHASMSRGYQQTRTVATTPAPGFTYVKVAVLACQLTGNEDLVGLIIERLTSALIICPEARRQVELVILPFLDFLRKQRETAHLTKPLPDMENLLTVSIDAYFTAPPSTTLSFGGGTISAFFQALLLHNNTMLFFTSILPKLSQVHERSNGLEFILRKLYDFQGQFTTPEGYTGITVRSVIDGLVEKYVAFSATQPGHQMIQVLETILHVKSYAATVTYLNTAILALPGKQEVSQRVETLITSAGPLVKRYGLRALAPLCGNLLRYWVEHVLGKPPGQHHTHTLLRISQWLCDCARCVPVKRFLGGPESSIQMSFIGAPARRHVEQQIGLFAGIAAAYETIRTSPQGLLITKRQQFLAPQQWKSTQEKGRMLLRGLSPSEEDLQLLLGDDYGMITSAIYGTKRKESTRLPEDHNGAGPSTVMSAVSRPAKRQRVAVDDSTVIDLT